MVEGGEIAGVKNCRLCYRKLASKSGLKLFGLGPHVRQFRSRHQHNEKLGMLHQLVGPEQVFGNRMRYRIGGPGIRQKTGFLPSSALDCCVLVLIYISPAAIDRQPNSVVEMLGRNPSVADDANSEDDECQ